jgi:hypothetical protein
MVAGAILFTVAMVFDQSDRQRLTRRADTAFWLHVSASLLVLPALFSIGHGQPGGPWLTAAIFAGLILLAVAIDRRAPVLVAMPFVIAAFATSAKGAAPVTLAVCVVLIVTTLFWERLRAFLLRWLLRFPAPIEPQSPG